VPAWWPASNWLAMGLLVTWIKVPIFRFPQRKPHRSSQTVGLQEVTPAWLRACTRVRNRAAT
jgi:hypothetical protein